ncbi:hypothetical protein OG607_41195 [Streptomyces sp. NBC_01537]|uniref:hypothetical protein n=1 Tax=Streptomyces sp. NBC_01537 TaxID=2903896 RepID=UPI0038694B07
MSQSDTTCGGHDLCGDKAGIEVINPYDEDSGPIVAWNTDPRTRFSDSSALWASNKPVPATAPRPAPKLSTTPTQPVAPASTARPAAHR